MAEQIGVIGHPEIESVALRDSHAFLVIATDGVWEFLSSQVVVDMVRAMQMVMPTCILWHAVIDFIAAHCSLLHTVARVA